MTMIELLAALVPFAWPVAIAVSVWLVTRKQL